MNNQTSSQPSKLPFFYRHLPILLGVIIVIIIAGGIFVWQYFGVPKEEVRTPEEKAPEEIKNKDHCAKLEFIEERASCYVTLAISKNDPSICWKVKIASLASSCWEYFEMKEWKIYRNERFGFKIKVPQILKIKERENTTVFGEPVLLWVRFWGDPLGTLGIDATPFVLEIRENTARKSIKEWFDAEIRGSEDDEIQEIEISDHSAIRWRSKIVPLDRYFIEKEEKVYAFWPTEGSNFSDEKFNEEFSKILSTFRFFLE